MQNLVLQPAGSPDAQKHFQKTIERGVNLEDIKDLLDGTDYDYLKDNFREKLEVWGVTPGTNNSNIGKFDKTNTGDLVLFTAKNKVIYIAQLGYKIHNKALAEKLWGNDQNNQTWEYIYFLVGGAKEDIPVSDLNDLLGYAPNNVIQGFSVLDSKKSEKVLDLYGNFENAFLEIKSHFSEPTEEEIEKVEKEVKNVKTVEDTNKLLDKIAEETKNVRAQEKTRMVKAVVRNRKIVDLIKNKYDYKCQICGAEGFEKRNGGKYAEVHHKEELATSKWDHPDNMICVCANCHRKLHYGKM